MLAISLFPKTVSAVPIVYGDDLNGSISFNGEVDEYTFSGTNGDKIIITMRGSSAQFDACLALLNPSNDIVAQHCNAGGMAEIEFTLASTGTHTIAAFDEFGNDLSSYGLSLQIVNDAAYVPSVNCGDDWNFTVGNLAEMEAFSLGLSSGDILRLQARASSEPFDLMLELYNPSGSLAASATEGADGMAVISGYVPTVTGTFTLIVTDGNGDETSSVAASLQKLNDPACAAPRACGDDWNFTLGNLAEMEAFSFFSTSGSSITVEAEASSSSLEEVIQIFSPNGNLLAADTAYSGSALISNFIIPATGDYIFLIFDDVGNETSSVAATLEGACIATLLCTNDLTLNQNPIPSNIYKVADTIISGGSVATGSDVTFQAGMSVTLEADFTVDLGAYLKVIIAECDLP